MKKTGDKLHIRRLEAESDAIREAGLALESTLVASRQDPVLLLLSGGSALKVLDEVDEKILTDNLTIAMLDERFSHDASVNNFTQLQDTDFYLRALERDVNFIGTLPRKEDTLQTLTQRYEGALRAWQREYLKGKIIAVMGMGPDGHTASIFPFKDNQEKFDRLFLADNWAVGYDNEGQKFPPERVTVTATFLKMIDSALAFVAGAGKKPALEKVLAKTGRLHQLPALIWWQMKKVQIFTDIQ